MPAVLIEAGMCGLPAATTDVAAIPEIVLDEATGVIADHTDDADAISAIRELLDSPRWGDAAVTERAVTHCTTAFGVRFVAERWLDAIQKVAR